MIYIRSILEQSVVVWHSSLTSKNRRDLERVQKVAVKVILGNNYTSYKNGLDKLNIQTLSERREQICFRFAKKSLKNDKARSMFQKSKTEHCMKKRKTQKYKIRLAKTKRFKKSAIPYMVKLLNDDEVKMEKVMNN